MRRSPLLPLVALLLAGCASASTSASGEAGGEGAAVAAAPARPLADLAAQRIVVVPAQLLRPGDTLGFAAAAGEPKAYLRRLDDELSFALTERGLGTRWVLPAEAVRIARRNPTFGIDPYALAAEDMRAGVRRPHPPEISTVLNGQLRALVALGGDATRYALVPGELRFEGSAAGRRAVLHLVLVDTRKAQVAWEGDVASDPVQRFSPALLASIAGHFANLISAP
jgi:hypothetical protein